LVQFGLQHRALGPCVAGYAQGTRFSDVLTVCLSVDTPPQVGELSDQEAFVNGCLGHEADEGLGLARVDAKQLCFIAFLPHILDSKAAGRNAYVQVSSQRVTQRFARLSQREAGRQPAQGDAGPLPL
jgi:hypothetical protein